MSDEKTSMESQLNEQSIELKRANDQLKQAERSRVELKSKLVELSVLKAQLQQQEILQREKDMLSNKLKNSESTVNVQNEQIAKESTKCRQLETELQKQKMQLKKATSELEETSHHLQQLRSEHDTCGRLRRSLETECAALRQQVESLEEELGRSKLNAHGSESMRKRLNNIEHSLLEKQNLINELENDNTSLKQQSDLASNKVQKLREELLTEKTRLADLLSRLRSICATCRSKSAENDQRFGDEEQLKDDNILIDTIDSLLLAAFTAARSEADSLRVERKIQLEGTF
ncbi:HOOK-N domain-containing protein [Aphelenchoides bicaudatus]|nr:HOOK-N domain-containing protein [Aphelenchoides bicaudatus]